MAWFSSMHVSLTGLDASKMRIEASTLNLANADSSAPDEASCFKPQRILLREAGERQGVATTRYSQELPARQDYIPDHPDADATGMVRFPEIDVVSEMVEMMAARRAYEIGLATLNEGRHLFNKTLEIGRE